LYKFSKFKEIKLKHLGEVTNYYAIAIISILNVLITAENCGCLFSGCSCIPVIFVHVIAEFITPAAVGLNKFLIMTYSVFSESTYIE